MPERVACRLDAELVEQTVITCWATSRETVEALWDLAVEHCINEAGAGGGVEAE